MEKSQLLKTKKDQRRKLKLRKKVRHDLLINGVERNQPDIGVWNQAGIDRI